VVFSWGGTPQVEVFWLPLPNDPLGHYYGSNFSETRPKSASFESLNDFLAYLEPKLWQKKQNW